MAVGDHLSFPWPATHDPPCLDLVAPHDCVSWSIFSVPIPEPHMIKAPDGREGRKVVHNGIVERFPFLMTGGEGDKIVCRPDLKAPLAFRPFLTFQDLQRLQQYLSR